MARKQGSPTQPDKQKAPLVRLLEGGVTAKLAQYQTRRKAFDLERRFGELLWNPQAAQLEYPYNQRF